MNKKVLVLLIVIIYIIIGAIVPFIDRHEVTKNYKNNFNISKFYKTSDSSIYAAPIRDNDEARIERIRAINNSNEKIIIASYRLLADDVGKIYIASLMDAAERGVDIKIILDGNSLVLNLGKNIYLKALDSYDNVEIIVYNPMRLTRPWSLMGRMHDKYMIVDEKIAFLGGRNIENRFFKSGNDENYDWDIVAYSDSRADGDFIDDLTNYFYDVFYNGARNKPLNKAILFSFKKNTEKEKSELDNLYKSDKEKYPLNYEDVSYKNNLIRVKNINLIKNPIGVYSKEPQAFYDITSLLLNANDEVKIHTPYFMANKYMYDMTKEIAENSKTTLFLNSPYNNANMIGVGDFILNNKKFNDLGIDILLNSKDNSYHGKTFIVDKNISAIGSFNWDMRSVYIDTELMMVVYGEDFNEKLREDYNFYEHDATAVLEDGTLKNLDGKEYKKASILKRVFSVLLVILLSPFRFLF